MTGTLRTAVILALAALLLAACGAPASVREGEHPAESESNSTVAAADGHMHAATPTIDSAGHAHADAGAADSAGHTHTEAAGGGQSPVPLGDPARGAALFTTMFSEVGFACATCHRVDSDEQLVGPGLLNVASHAAGHVPGLSVEEYLYQSITDPGAYVVPGFPDNLMPRTYRELFTDEQIGDLMAYLLSLGG